MKLNHVVLDEIGDLDGYVAFSRLPCLRRLNCGDDRHCEIGRGV